MMMEGSTSAAHRCLSIGEVQEDITKHLANGCNRITLAYLARTCKAFHEAAQSALWREVDLGAVLCCFPKETWEKVNSELHLCRLPFPGDWRRFVLCASRVQTLHVTKYHGCLTDIFLSLACYTSSHLLFPNLRRLHIHYIMLGCLQLFLSPKLKSLTIKYDIGSEIDPSSVYPLRMLSQNCPLLQELVVEGDGVKIQTLVHNLAITISSLKDVQVLDILTGYLPDNAIMHLSTLASLRKLACTLSLNSMLGGSSGPPSQFFPALESITLPLIKMNEASRWFITSLTSEHLRTVTLIGNYEPSYTVIKHLQGLHKHSDSLQDLNLAFPILVLNTTAALVDLADIMDSPPNRPECILNEQVFSHLLPLHNLHHLEIMSSYLDLHDDGVRDIVDAMPKLQHLVLLPTYYRPWVLRTTVRSVVYAATRCPNMRTLGLRFDATKKQCRIPAGTKPNVALRQLYVGDSPIRAPASFALLLSAIAMDPDLRISENQARYPWDEDYFHECEESRTLWEDVKTMFRNLCLARAQERIRADNDLVFK